MNYNLKWLSATWDAPPRPNEPGYAAFKRAFDRFIDSREVLIPKQSAKYWEVFDDRKKDDYRKFMLKSASDLDLGQDSKFKLMPFQVDGFNWLCSNWWNHQHCILADEMGLVRNCRHCIWRSLILCSREKLYKLSVFWEELQTTGKLFQPLSWFPIPRLPIG